MRYAFSNLILDTEAHVLLRAGEPCAIEPQVFDLLVLLVRHAGALVTKDQLVDSIWGGRIVSESAISARIAAARKAVGDDGKNQRIIKTVARRGLQFVADVTTLDDAPPAPDTAPPRPKVRYATADDGVKIAFSVMGSGPPLLRIAHHPAHLELEWGVDLGRALFVALSRRFTLIRMDHRGSGLSDLDVDDFSARRAAKDMASVLDAMGVEKTAVLGTSSGGMIGVEFAATYPERTTRLITLGGYVDGRSIREGAVPDPILSMAKAGWDTPDSAFLSGYMSVYFPTASPEVLQQLGHIAQNSCPVENGVAGREYFNTLSIADRLAHVTAPTLVIHGRGDAVHPLSEAQKLARGVPNAELLVLETRNHYPLPDEPVWAEMIAAIYAFAADAD